MKHIGNITFVLTVYVEVKSEFSQIFKTDVFAKIVKGFKLSNICARTSSYVYELVFNNNKNLWKASGKPLLRVPASASESGNKGKPEAAIRKCYLK